MVKHAFDKALKVTDEDTHCKATLLKKILVCAGLSVALPMFIETTFRTSSVKQQVSIFEPLYRGELDFRSAEGFEDIILREPSSGLPRLISVEEKLEELE